MTNISRVVAEKLLPQNGDGTEKKEKLFTMNTSIYMNRLLEKASSNSSDSLGKILATSEAKNYINQSIAFQDLVWEIVDHRINKDYQRIMSVAMGAMANQSGLQINEILKIPKHQQMTNIHRMPGGYLFDNGNQDILAGLRYINYLYLLSQGSPFDSFSDNLVPRVKSEFIDYEYPNFIPKRILDLGCGIGLNTTSLKNLYPHAKVMGVDLGSAMLRYGYANSRLLNQEVEFYQQNAECTDFPNEYFDLVISFLLFHEIPKTSMMRIINECSRLLSSGGLMLHFDSGMFLDPQTIEAKIIRDVQALYNNEIFIVSPPLSTIEKMIEDSGIKPIITKIGDRNALNNNLRRWQIIAGIKL